MQLSAQFAVLLFFAAMTPQLQAGTMAKCVDAAGKITFTTEGCSGKAETVKTFINEPEEDQSRAERVARDTEKLKKADEEFKVRHGRRLASQARDEAVSYQPAPKDKGPVHYRDKDKKPDPFDSMSAEEQERYLQGARAERRCANVRRC